MVSIVHFPPSRVSLRPDPHYPSFQFPEFTVTYRKSESEPECLIPESLYRNALKAHFQVFFGACFKFFFCCLHKLKSTVYEFTTAVFRVTTAQK